MKAFFEEYGMIIFVCVVVLLLIGLTQGLGEPILNALKGIVDSWSEQINSAIQIGS